jgi:CheY-like chemotaxis protein
MWGMARAPRGTARPDCSIFHRPSCFFPGRSRQLSSVFAHFRIAASGVLLALTRAKVLVIDESPARHVLVVDDEPLMCWSVAQTLGARGDIVSEACSGATAIRSLNDAHGDVDVVLLDYELPDSHDLTLLSTVRRLAPSSRVILMSAYFTPAMRRDALALGADRVVSKPIDMDDLPAIVGDEPIRATAWRA